MERKNSALDGESRAGQLTGSFPAAGSVMFIASSGRSEPISSGRLHSLQQDPRSAEPGTFTPTKIAWHGRSLGQDALCPLPRLLAFTLPGKENRVVVLGLRQYRYLCGAGK